MLLVFSQSCAIISTVHFKTLSSPQKKFHTHWLWLLNPLSLSPACDIHKSVFYLYITKSGDLAAPHSKASQEARLVESKVYFGCQQWGSGSGGKGGGENSCPQANSTIPPTISEQELFLRKGDTCRNSTVISDRHLEISPRWSDQHHLGCFKHSYSSVPGSICFCFLEADSPNVKAYVMAAVWSSRMCVCTQSCLTLCDPMKACQVSLSMEFFRQEYCGGLPFLSPGDLPDPRIETASLVFPALTGGFITTSATWINFFYLVGISVSTRQLTGYGSERIIFNSPWRGTRCPWLGLMINLFLVFLDCFPLFLHFFTYLIKFMFWLKLFYKRQMKVMEGKDHSALLHFIHGFAYSRHFI